MKLVNQLAPVEHKFAYVTVITNSSYLKGLTVLVRSFQKTHSAIPLYVLLPTDAAPQLKAQVAALGIYFLESERITIRESFIQSNPLTHWNETFFKINICKLTQFNKIVYLDADMIVQKNIDCLFQYPSISATTGGKSENPQWTEFNSGIMVIEPSVSLFDEIVKAIEPAIIRRQALGLGFGDQDVFNQYYSDWNDHEEHKFSELFNAETLYINGLMKNYGLKRLRDVYVIHYIGGNKIWNNTLKQNLILVCNCLTERRIWELKAYLLYFKYMLCT